MPELPEVETFVRALRPLLVGRTFQKVIATWSNSVKPSPRIVAARLPGQRVESLARRGKYLVFTLSNGEALLLHLKMSGDLLVEPAASARHAHVRTAFLLDNGMELRFKDPRKFGRVFLAEHQDQIVGKLGPEPLGPEFTAAALRECFMGRSGRLKALLLNQEVIAGIGNIYADESCFGAGVRPTRRAKSLTRSEIAALHQSIRSVLKRSIRARGSTFDGVYRGGEFQSEFKVYGRGGESCRECRATIKRIVLGARSTHFCPRCQR